MIYFISVFKPTLVMSCKNELEEQKEKLQTKTRVRLKKCESKTKCNLRKDLPTSFADKGSRGVVLSDMQDSDTVIL